MKFVWAEIPEQKIPNLNRNAATGSIITGNLTEIQVESYRLSGGSVPENEAAASTPACFGTVRV